MSAITVAEILDHIRLVYDINKNEKAAKLGAFLEEIVDDITAQVPGALTATTTTLSASGTSVDLPDDLETIYAMYSGSMEVKPVDPFTFEKWQAQSGPMNPYGLIQTATDGSNYVLTLGNSASSTIRLAYKRRISDVTKIPAIWKYIVIAGMKYLYEKHELNANETQWAISLNVFNEKVYDLAVRTSNQDNYTKQVDYRDEWTNILMRI